MTPRAGREQTSLSIITLQSLVDQGYEVDLTQADPYTRPTTGGAALRGPQIDLGHDVLLPIYAVSPSGAVTRVREVDFDPLDPFRLGGLGRR